MTSKIIKQLYEEELLGKEPQKVEVLPITSTEAVIDTDGIVLSELLKELKDTCLFKGAMPEDVLDWRELSGKYFTNVYMATTGTYLGGSYKVPEQELVLFKIKPNKGGLSTEVIALTVNIYGTNGLSEELATVDALNALENRVSNLES